MVASSNGEDGRFSVYKSEFDSLCDYHCGGVFDVTALAKSTHASWFA